MFRHNLKILTALLILLFLAGCQGSAQTVGERVEGVAEATAVPSLQLTWPNNEEAVDNQPILQWQAFPGAVNYQVIVLDDGAYPPQVVIDQTVTEPMLAVDTPLKPGHYSWTVWAHDGETAVLAQLNSAFTVKDALTIIAPAAEATVGVEPLLQWQSYPDAVKYQIIIIDAAAFPPVVVLDQTTNDMSFTVTPALKAGSYTWTVWAFDSSNKLLAELNSSFTVATTP